MKKYLPKNKFLKWLIIVVAAYILLFLLVKLININSENCEVDDDCIHHYSTCQGCEIVSFNKKYSFTKNVEQFLRCAPQFPINLLQYLLYYKHVDCFETGLRNSYCSEEKKCEFEWIGCDVICENPDAIKNNTRYSENYLDYVIDSCFCEII